MLFRYDVVARNRRVATGPRHRPGYLMNVFDLTVTDLFFVVYLRMTLDLFGLMTVVRMGWLQGLWGMMHVMVVLVLVS